MMVWKGNSPLKMAMFGINSLDFWGVPTWPHIAWTLPLFPGKKSGETNR